jgi:hypothetical protein
MKVDTYTKGLLTVIAACLVWICLNGAIPAAQAQAGQPQPTRVVLVDANGALIRALPVIVANQSVNVAVTNPQLAVAVSNTSLPVAVRSIERGASWDPIPVQVMRDPPTLMPTP